MLWQYQKTIHILKANDACMISSSMNSKITSELTVQVQPLLIENKLG